MWNEKYEADIQNWKFNVSVKGQLRWENFVLVKSLIILDPEIRKMLVMANLGTRISHFIQVLDLLAVEMKIVFLKLTV